MKTHHDIAADLRNVAAADIFTDAPECDLEVEVARATITEAASALSATSSMHLHYIKAGDEENNFDWFVWAADPEAAIVAWEAESGGGRSDIDRIWQLPTTAPAAAAIVAWPEPIWKRGEWSGRPDPSDPDNYWIDDATGERVNAATGERGSVK